MRLRRTSNANAMLATDRTVFLKKPFRLFGNNRDRADRDPTPPVRWALRDGMGGRPGKAPFVSASVTPLSVPLRRVMRERKQRTAQRRPRRARRRAEACRRARCSAFADGLDNTNSIYTPVARLVSSCSCCGLLEASIEPSRRSEFSFQELIF